TRGNAPGGNVIVAVDAATGKEAWRFHTVARPGDPGGDSWNGLPTEKRSGGGVWVPGTYDATLDLVFFGPSPTYDTAPLRERAKGGVPNDAEHTTARNACRP